MTARPINSGVMMALAVLGGRHANGSILGPLNPFRRPPYYAHSVRLSEAPSFRFVDGMIKPAESITDWISANIVGGWESCMAQDSNDLVVSFEHADEAVLFRLRWEGAL